MVKLRHILYAPNQITLLRMVFVAPVIVSILYGAYTAAFVLVLIAGLSDGVDGLLARKLGQQTTLGTYLDPIADKLLLTSSFVALGVSGHLPLWLIILVVSRDISMMVTALVIMLTTPLRTFPPSLYGKANTAAQIGTVMLTLLALIRPTEWLEYLAAKGVYLTAAFTVVSGLHYVLVTASRLRAMDRGAS